MKYLYWVSTLDMLLLYYMVYTTRYHLSYRYTVLSTYYSTSYYLYSPPSIIHYTTYVYMSCEGYTNTSTVLDATIGIQTIGVYL